MIAAPLPTAAICDRKSDDPVTPSLPSSKQEIAGLIRTHWRQTLPNVIRIGTWLDEAKFRKTDFARYALPISFSWGKRLIKIARCPRILNPAYHPVLPDRADALHQITLLSDKLFEIGVKEGIINKNCIAVDIHQLRRSFLEPGNDRRRRMTLVVESESSADRGALEDLERFLCSVEQMAAARYPLITVRRPRRMKDFTF